MIPLALSALRAAVGAVSSTTSAPTWAAGPAIVRTTSPDSSSWSTAVTSLPPVPGCTRIWRTGSPGTRGMSPRWDGASPSATMVRHRPCSSGSIATGWVIRSVPSRGDEPTMSGAESAGSKYRNVSGSVSRVPTNRTGGLSSDRRGSSRRPGAAGRSARRGAAVTDRVAGEGSGAGIATAGSGSGAAAVTRLSRLNCQPKATAPTRLAAHAPAATLRHRTRTRAAWRALSVSRAGGTIGGGPIRDSRAVVRSRSAAMSSRCDRHREQRARCRSISTHWDRLSAWSR